MAAALFALAQLKLGQTVLDASVTEPLPTLYLGHGAPPLLDEPTWMAQLSGWAAGLNRPKAILIVSAHWESAPVTVGATTQVPLVYDFYGFPAHYYRMRYDSPGAPDLAQKVAALMPFNEPVMQMPNRGLDHGAWVPLKAMYPGVWQASFIRNSVNSVRDAALLGAALAMLVVLVFLQSIRKTVVIGLAILRGFRRDIARRRQAVLDA